MFTTELIAIIIFWGGLLGYQATTKSIGENGKYWPLAFIMQCWIIPTLFLFGIAVSVTLLIVSAFISVFDVPLNRVSFNKEVFQNSRHQQN